MANLRNLNLLVDKLEPSVRKAFFQAIAGVQNDVQFALLELALKSGNVDEAMRVIGLGAEYFRPLEEAMRAAHLAGGDWAIASVKAMAAKQGAVVSGIFDATNPRAAAILNKWSSEAVVGITEATRQAVRETLVAGINQGTSARQAALNLVGRIGPNGKRTGGVLGLDPNRARLVRTVRDMLSDADAVAGYFTGRKPTFKSTNRQFDAAVRRAIANKTAVPTKVLNRLTTALEARLLKQRGETVARTELLGSTHAAQAEALDQLVESGAVNQEAITQQWDASADRFTRASHREADNQRRKKGEPFDIGGVLMKHPGDRSAPAKEVINCRCFLKIDIDFTKGLKSRLTSTELSQTRALF